VWVNEAPLVPELLEDPARGMALRITSPAAASSIFACRHSPSCVSWYLGSARPCSRTRFSIRRGLDKIRAGFAELVVHVADRIWAGLQEVAPPQCGRDVRAERFERGALHVSW